LWVQDRMLKKRTAPENIAYCIKVGTESVKKFLENDIDWLYFLDCVVPVHVAENRKTEERVMQWCAHKEPKSDRHLKYRDIIYIFIHQRW